MEASHIEVIWNRFRDRLLGFIRARVSSLEEAEDITQEVFVRMHTGLCCLQEWPAMERWIYRVTRNLIIDHYRSRKTSVALVDDIEVLADDIAASHDQAEYDDDPVAALAFSLEETVDELPEPYRRAMILTEFQGLTQAELAKTEGITLAAAKSRILRAREKLKAILLDCCHFEIDNQGRIINYEKRCAHSDIVLHSSG